jgi:hypothetical protein
MHVLEIMERLVESGAAGQVLPIETRCERPTALPRRREIGLLD